MRQVVFLSIAARPMSEAALADYVTESRFTNSRYGITGVVLFKAGSFLQALEGPDEGVLEVYRQLGSDARHARVTLISEKFISERQYTSTHVMLYNLDQLQSSGTPSVRSFARVPLTMGLLCDNPSRAHQLLLALRSRV